MTTSILYVVHSSSLCGGAPLSLLYLLERLDRKRYTPVVACVYDAPDVVGLFRSRGIQAFHWPGISVFPHTTGGWYSLLSPFGIKGMAQVIGSLRDSIRATESLVRRVRPDIVHLNSLVLAPSAMGVKRAHAKLVWHIRETVHRGHLGLRRRWLQSQVMALADEAIFISEYDRHRLTGDRKGIVIPNFVDFSRFNRNLDGHEVRRELGLDSSARIVLFLGGVSRLKGALVLLAALKRVKREVPALHAIIASAVWPESNSPVARLARLVLPLVGSGTERQQFYRTLHYGNMEEYVHALPFRTDPERLIAAADLIVFPSTQPHFARPVIEAGAMAKPVVASRIGGVEELVTEGETGLLVPPNDHIALAKAICHVLTDQALARRLGEGGYKQALIRYNANINVHLIEKVYDKLLEDMSNHG